MKSSDKSTESLSSDLEEGNALTLDFGKLQAIGRGEASVIPVAVQNFDTKDVLIVAYVNQEALAYTLTHGVAAFWSTSRNELWVKGATSGDKLELIDVRVNCEQNSLLYLVRPLGAGACHTKGDDGKARASCYYRRVDRPENTAGEREEQSELPWRLAPV